MDRYIGIDFGRKRTGLAQSDPLGMFASPIDTLPTHTVLDFLAKKAAEDNIKAFIIGWPTNMNGALSEAAKDVEAFIKNLTKKFPAIPVIKEDERFTSVLAHRAMIDGGMKKSDRMKKESVDKISASIILQSYLDKQ